MNIQLIAIDLDGTTLDSQRNIPAKNLQALQTAINAGIVVVPTTGRVHGSVDARILALSGIRYLICSNGAVVIDRQRRQTLYENLMPAVVAGAVLEILRGEAVCYDVYLDGRAYTTRQAFDHLEAYGISPARIEHVRATRTAVDDLAAFVARAGRDIEKINLIFRDRDQQRRLTRRIALLEDVVLTCSVPDIVDVNYRGANKGDGLAHLCALLHIPASKVMAVGDGGNDIEMLDFAGCSVAMANAAPAVKHHALFLTGSNDACGLAQAIERFALEADRLARRPSPNR